VEADALGVRKARSQRAESGEGGGGLGLGEEADRGGDLSLGVVRGQPRRPSELALG